MSKPGERTSVGAYVAIAGSLTAVFLALAIGDAQVTARNAASANVDRTIGEAFTGLDAFLNAASAELASYVANGFGRLSSDTIAGQPNLGIVGARLRIAESVYPLRVPFARVAIADDSGTVLWMAEGPGAGETLRFGHVTRGSGSRLDSTTVAAALDGGAPPRMLRVEGGVRLMQVFHADPYDRPFVVAADLTQATLRARLEPYCVDSAHIRYAIEPSSDAPQARVEAPTRSARLIDAAVAWPDLRWEEARQHPLSGLVVRARVDLGNRLQTILWRHKFAFLAAVSAFATGLVFVRRLSAADAPAAPVAQGSS